MNCPYTSRDDVVPHLNGNRYQYCSDKQGRRNSTPAAISPSAQEQLASTKKFPNLRSIGTSITNDLGQMTNDQCI
ncbi:hypothetical protein GTQ43_00285 [Nostoc sp. KVJ3]|uniref:hypothetical protein n=1 Tax=Nostoc sp. KVJ3 TaxID=457945 RepID=UPI002237573E|nr:hypothetical protein [Nostoc sp. KVJ3]MCW5312344.1 hypothetical protein [Nostoc sp. KVJ3]